MSKAQEIDGKRRYGVWAGRPNGWPESPTRCIEEVSDGKWHTKQCTFKRLAGTSHCKRHAYREESQQ